jgi:hypothetical protein
MGIPLTRPSYIYDDNKSQVTNSTRSESTLKKKCNSICYHAVRESVAMGKSRITHISTGHNHSDLMTKVTSGAKRWRLDGSIILYDIYDDHPHLWRQDQPVQTTWSWGDWRNKPMCIYGLVTGWREWKVSFVRRAGRINGRVSDVHFPNLQLPFPCLFR